MDKRTAKIWVSTAGIIGVAFGIFYALFGLSSFPAYSTLIPKDVITPWSNGLYGATFIGFSVLLYCIGRYAIQKNDKVLMKLVAYGIYAWLIVEAAFSVVYKVYFNVGVDVLLAVFLGFPLISRIKSKD